jgi:gliding motility-associated-like protein
MKKFILLTIWFNLVSLLSWANQPPTTEVIHFIENKGQWDDRVQFKVKIPNGNLFFHRGGFTYDFLDEEMFHHHDHEEHTANNGQIVANEGSIIQTRTSNAPPPQENAIKAHALKVMFLDFSPSYLSKGFNESPAYYNFYYGNDERKWASNVKAYQGVEYQQIYPNIHFQMKEYQAGLKYEFLVEPNGNPNQILMEYSGADEMSLDNGKLKVVTSLMTLIEQEPIAYQLIDNQKIIVPCRFKLNGNKVSFELPEGYQKQYPLIIDPILTFSTYSGSFADNWGFTATYDDDGNLYAGGIVLDNRQFPISSGAYQAVFRGGIADLSIIKYNHTGSGIVFATYLGGSDIEVPTSMVVNSKDELIVFGTTGSSNFPVTTTAPFISFKGGTFITPLGGLPFANGSDLFISKLSADGKNLLGSTYLGGSGNDGINTPNSIPTDGTGLSIVLNLHYGDEFRGEVVVDGADNIYIASCTFSNDLPANGFKTFNSGNEEGIVARFNSSLSAMNWSTYIGGSASDAAYSLKVRNNRVFVAGGTRSSNLAMSGAGINKTFFGGIIDGFIYVLNSTGTSLLASSFLGTSFVDEAYHVDIDDSGNPVVAGTTFGTYTKTNGVYSSGTSGQFIHKLSSTLDQTSFSTTLSSGAAPDISITAFSIDKCGNIYLAGWGGATNTTHIGGNTFNLPLTSNAFQSNTDGSDFYIAMLSKDAKALLYGTYLGHISQSGLQEHVDGGTSRFSPEGIVYHSVCSCGTSTFPTTQGAWSNVNNSSIIGDPTTIRCNIASFKFELEKLKSDFSSSVNSGCAPLTINFTSNSENATSLLWDMGDGNVFKNLDNFNHTYTKAGTYTVTLTAENDFLCTPDILTKIITVHSKDGMSVSNPSVTLCNGETAQLQANGGVFYQWSPTTGLSNPNAANPIANPTSTTNYQVLVRNQFGCDTLIKVSVKRIPKITNDFSVSANACSPDTLSHVTVKNNSSGGNSYSFNMGDGKTFTLTNGTGSFSYKYASAGTYNVTISTTTSADSEKCKPSSLTRQITINSPTKFKVSKTEFKICEGQTAQLQASGGSSYTWSPITGLSNPNIANPVANPSQTTNYKVTIKDDNGCDSVLNVKVIRLPKITINFSTSVKPCSQDTLSNVFVTNSSVGAESYSFNMGDGKTVQLSDGDASFYYKYAKEGNYAITLNAEVAEANLQCKPTSTSQTITINPATKFTVNKTQYALCEGETAQLQASGGTSYQWFPALGLSKSDIANPVANPDQSTEYSVLIKTSFGCDTTIKVNVKRIQKVELNFSSTTVQCSNDTIAAVKINNLSTGASSYSFNMGDGKILSIGENQKTFSYKYSQAGTYNITLSVSEGSDNPQCNPSPIQQQITVNPAVLFRMETANEFILCKEETVQLKASGASEYTWTPIEGLSDATIANPVANPSETTTYTVAMKNSFGCDTTFKVLVKRIPKIATDFSYEVTGCGEITVTNNSEGANLYIFDMGDGKTIRTSNPKNVFKHQYSVGGVYSVTLKTEVSNDAKKCQPANLVKEINSQPITEFSVNNTFFSICEGETAQLEAKGGVAYQWTPSTGLSNVNIANPIANPTNTTTYQVFIKDNFNCDTTISVTVERVVPIVANFSVLFKEVCDTVPLVQIQNQSVGGKRYEFVLSDGKSFITTDDNALIETRLASGNYTITIKATHPNPNCRQEKVLNKDFTVPFDESILFKDATISSNAQICYNETITLTATGGVRYLWTPSTGLNIDNESSVQATLTENKTYTVRIFNSKGCFTDKQVTVSVVPDFVVDFDYSLSTPCGELPILTVNNKSNGAEKYTWKIGSKTFENTIPANYRLEEEGDVTLTLIGDKQDCYEEKTMILPVDRTIPPNVFTPNGDKINDTFEIPSRATGWKLVILNRWGEKLYESEDYKNDWDGKEFGDTEFFYHITSPDGDECKGYVRKL